MLSSYSLKQLEGFLGNEIKETSVPFDIDRKLTEEEISEKRVPLLGKIPLLGWLFKKKVVSAVETEFVIYLVPSVENMAERETLSEKENLLRLKRKYGEEAK